MFWMKRCSRCSGDLHTNADSYGTYIGCLQCGYILPDVEQFALLRPREVHHVPGVGERQGVMAA